MRCPEHRAAPAAEPNGGPGADCPECAEWLRAERRLAELAGQAPGPSESWSGGLMGRLDEALGRD
ncbi:hypothetical protein AB0K43_01955 [Kitasatospora sp. NPDC049258]|uniref:hypothetical protein n=1 Tax=Kitasatospora sp. NPDC049258 TaxID=3155394 RepID=UPI003448CF65